MKILLIWKRLGDESWRISMWILQNSLKNHKNSMLNASYYRTLKLTSKQLQTQLKDVHRKT